MPRVRVISRNFMEMVAALPAAKLDLLYERHWTCQAVLRFVCFCLTHSFHLLMIFVEFVSGITLRIDLFS